MGPVSYPASWQSYDAKVLGCIQIRRRHHPVCLVRLVVSLGQRIWAYPLAVFLDAHHTLPLGHLAVPSRASSPACTFLVAGPASRYPVACYSEAAAHPPEFHQCLLETFGSPS